MHSQQIIKAQAKRRIQEKIIRQSQRWLSLVEGQKLRAQRMAATGQRGRPADQL